jgi:hypothetical protein
MKDMNMKSFLIVTLFLTSVFAMPMAATGYDKSLDDRLELSQVDTGIFEGFQGGFGALFGENMGYGGEILGSIFQTLFLQGLNLSAREKLDNVFVLSANQTRHETGTYDFAAQGRTTDIFFAPEQYNENLTGVASDAGFAYCEIEREGAFNYNLEIGAGITLVIWDHDRSFINAVLKLINFFNTLKAHEDDLGDEIPKDLIRDGIALITWFLIHINDIFTGDELFILNPITWQRLDIDPLPGYNVTKTWKVTGDDFAINGPVTDQALNSLIDTNDWKLMANATKDSYMQWLLSPTSVSDIGPTVWTQFSFDLIQLWIKNFEIHIDVAEILDAARNQDGGSPERAIINAFGGCDIEFYLFTHHLTGAFLYNDLNGDNRLSANYVDLINKSSGLPILDNEGDPVQVPFDNELTHRLVLGTVNNFKFETPKINKNNKSISWGLTLEDAEISAVPIGVDLNSYLKAPIETLNEIHFGFTFEPQIDKELDAGKGNLKVVHKFDPWNGDGTPNAPIDGLDLAILYVSSVLHFHLNIATKGEIPDEPEELLKHDHYSNTTNEITIGNYIGRKAQEELEFVDIAGPEYLYGNDESTAKSANATTNILPLIVWEWEMDRHDTIYSEEGSADNFASNISIDVEFDVLLYAVCYPNFNGTGVGIWHDPTFSVYLIFESKEFWALVVLIAGVGLVGVATILIKRRKDMRV